MSYPNDQDWDAGFEAAGDYPDIAALTNRRNDMGDREQAAKELLEFYNQWFQPPKELIGQMNRGGVTLDFLGHGNAPRALIEFDPLWAWEPMAYDDSGLPLLERDQNGEPCGLWIVLTLKGKRLPGYGSVESRKTDKIKELIGDAIRNAAMRFGLALALWIKDDELGLVAVGTETVGGSRSAKGKSGSGSGSPPSLPDVPTVDSDVAAAIKEVAVRNKELGRTDSQLRALASDALGRPVKNRQDIRTHEDVEKIQSALDQIESAAKSPEGEAE